VSNLFGESDDSGEEFEGFHHEWMTTDPLCFQPDNIPNFVLNGGRACPHQAETTAAYLG